jgi:hypothetical protein
MKGNKKMKKTILLLILLLASMNNVRADVLMPPQGLSKVDIIHSTNFIEICLNGYYRADSKNMYGRGYNYRGSLENFRSICLKSADFYQKNTSELKQQLIDAQDDLKKPSTIYWWDEKVKNSQSLYNKVIAKEDLKLQVNSFFNSSERRLEQANQPPVKKKKNTNDDWWEKFKKDNGLKPYQY